MGTHQKHNFSYRLFLNESDGFAHSVYHSTIGRYFNRQLDAALTDNRTLASKLIVGAVGHAPSAVACPKRLLTRINL